MKFIFRNIVSYVLIGVIVLTSPSFVLAQQTAPAGVLTVSGPSTSGNLVTVNGENAFDGRSVFSPAKIITAAEGNATVRIPSVGVVMIKPASTINLAYNSSSISGDVLAGKVVIETFGQTALNLLMVDGTLITPNPAVPTIVEITVTGGRTQINTLQGEVVFNGTRIPAGQTAGNQKDDAVPPPSNNSLLFVLLGVAAIAVVALVVGGGGGGGNSPPPVSPTR